MIKQLFILMVLIMALSFKAYTQKTDSIYYVLDTLKTPKNDLMWKIENEGPMQYYTILCPCLEYGQNPTLIRRIDMENKVLKINDIKKIKIVNLAQLIKEIKQYNTKKNSVIKAFFLIEPYKKNYMLYKMGIIAPKKPFISDDHEDIYPDSLKRKTIH